MSTTSADESPLPDARGRTVLLVVEQGFAARFFLRTDVLTTLRAAGARVVVLVPNPDEGYLRAEMAEHGVDVEALHASREVVARSRLWWLVHNLRTFTLAQARRSPAFLDYYQGFRDQVAADNHPAVAWAIHLALRPVWRSRLLRRALLALEARCFSPPLHADVFERHRPDLVVAPSPGWFTPDALVLREAARRGVRTAAVVLAWDNPTNKGYRGANPDHTIVWSARMGEQLARHHDYPRERLSVGGVPHFDSYLREDGLPSRAELFADLGLDPDRRLVLFAARSPASYPHSGAVAAALARALSEDRLGAPAQLVVRLHPVSFRPGYGVPVEQYRELEAAHPHVHVNVPQVVSQRLRSDMPPSESARLGGLIRHCDVLVNAFSTTSLEALLVDRPVVMVAPEAHLVGGEDVPPAPPAEYERHFAEYEHTRELVDGGAVRVASSMPELVALVRRYLEDPGLDRDQRRAAAGRECGPLDGRSGRRVGVSLVEMAGARRTQSGGADGADAGGADTSEAAPAAPAVAISPSAR